MWAIALSSSPKSPAGNRTARFHQSLTADIGSPHLAAQINQIITLFQLSDNMKHMWAQFEKLKQRQAGQLEIPFKFDEKGHTVLQIPLPQGTLGVNMKSSTYYKKPVSVIVKQASDVFRTRPLFRSDF